MEKRAVRSRLDRRSWKAGLAATAAVAGVLSFMPTSANAAVTTRWVDAAAASPTPGSGCGTDAGYATVQAAVTASTSGDVIHVCPGVYVGDVSVTGTATVPRTDLTIVGAKAGIAAGPAAVPADRGTGESTIVGTIRFTGISTGATIDGLEIQSGATHGITTGKGPFTFRNIVFRGAPGTPGGAATQNAIHTGNFSGYLVEGNNVQGYRQFVSASTGGTIGTPSTIRDNYVSGWAPGANAIVFGSNSESGHVVSGNVFENGPAGSNAINISNGQNFQITGNTIRNSGNGIFAVQSARTTGNQITGNDFTNNAIGVWFFADGTTVYPASGSAANEVHLNNIVGNTNYGILNQAPAGANDIAGSCNWWGQAAGPSTTAPNRVSSGVTYTPWLVAPAPGGDCTGGMLAPTADVIAAPTSGDAPLPVDFDASDSSDVDGTITNYAWDFGDGNTGTGVTTSHTYTTPGTYTATVTVTDNSGLTGTDSEIITVTPPNAAPTADVQAAPTSGTVPLVVSFDGSASSDSDGSVVSYAWDFGDGNTGTGPTTSHTYTTPGTFTATLTVTDDEGLTNTDEVVITVNVVPQPQTDNDCKKGGWESYHFRNQGQCVRYVSTGKDDRIGQ
jgi:PKD repeat protein